MRVIVCGGRSFNDDGMLEKYLDMLNAIHRIALVIHGGAQGADTLAEGWAHSRHIDSKKFPAEWKVHGRAAGPMRNLQMIRQGFPDLVIAFPGRRGTLNMKMQASVEGIKLIDLALETERIAIEQQYRALKAA